MNERKTVTVAGKEYSLRLTLKSLRLVGETLGIKIRPGHVTEDLMDHPIDLGAFGVMLWACLQHHADAPKLEDVEGSVDQDNFGEVVDAFFGLFGATSAARRMKESLSDALAGAETPEQTEETGPVA